VNLFRNSLIGILCSTGLLIGSAIADDDDDGKQYDVTITNLTRGEIFTPIMVVTHTSEHKMFMLGDAASAGLAAMAEGGDTAALSASLSGDSESTGALLPPGESVTVRITASEDNKYISVAAMLIPTNDAFFAVNAVKLPKGKRAMTIMSPAYDAGSEPNDELCANMPGPFCGGAGGSPDAGGEGFISIHAGIHGIGDLVAADFDWRNPTAKIVIKRVKD